MRLDFYDAATELFKRSFTAIPDWCEANGLIMTGHYIVKTVQRANAVVKDVVI